MLKDLNNSIGAFERCWQQECYLIMKRPWNLPDLPVYSLATYLDDPVNINACTYVTAISMQPKLFAIAVYNNTKTLENLLQTNTVVLHYLHPIQYGLVKLLGKKSGKLVNKHAYLKKKQLLTNWQGYPVLKNASALVLMQKIDHKQTGDHVLFTFEALKFKSYSSDVLTTSILREKKIISV